LAVRAIREIAMQTELFGRRHSQEIGINRHTKLHLVSAVVRAASVVASELRTRAVAVWTDRGDTARLLSKHRLDQPIIALASNPLVCRQMSLLHGVVPIQLERADDFDAMFCDIDRVLVQRDLAAINDQITVIAGTRLNRPGETNALFIHLVGSGECPVPLMPDAGTAKA
jgi:pyruvate kinase